MKINGRITTYWAIIRRRGFRLMFPILYLMGLVFAMILTILSYFFPFMIVDMGRGSFVSIGVSAGWMVALLMSLPGYYSLDFLENILSININGPFSLFLIFFISLLSYYLLGLLIDTGIKIAQPTSADKD